MTTVSLNAVLPLKSFALLCRAACRRLAMCMAAVVLLAGTAGAIDFVFYYTSPDGQGFFDPTTGAQRRAAMEAAGRAIGQLIAPTYAGETVQVRVHTPTNLDPGNLGSASASFFYDGFATADPRFIPDTHYPKALASHYLKSDIEPDHDDIRMNVNFNQPFYLGTDGVVPVGQYDLVSLAVHELIHGLGFGASFREEGGFGKFGDGTFDSDTGQSGLPLAYDRFVYVGTSGLTSLLSLDSDGRQGNVAGNNLYWIGANGTVANAGSRLKLYAPNPFESGSNVSHLDYSHANNIMNEGLAAGTSLQIISPLVRGILRDLGWNLSISPSTITWNANGGTNRASAAANWSNPTFPGKLPLPGDDLTFQNNLAGVYDVRMDLVLYSHGQIEFTPTAPAYTLRMGSFTDTELTAAGIVNGSVAAHTFILETYIDDFANNEPVSATRGQAATFNFRSAAAASNTIFQVHAGITEINNIPNQPPIYNRYNGAAVNFYDTSAADQATFTVQGASGDGATFTYARVNFRNSSTAGQATFINQPGRMGVAIGPSGPIEVVGWGGRTVFHDTSNAGFATFNNLGQDASVTGVTGTAGLTNFRQSATACCGTFNNLPATAANGLGGATQFFDTSTAGTSIAHPATFNNYGGTIQSGNGGGTYFTDNANAGNGTFINFGGTAIAALGGRTTFSGSASAGNANITNLPSDGGPTSNTKTDFYDNSTAASATIINKAGTGLPGVPMAGITTFHDSSSAGSATLLNQDGPNASPGQFVFNDSSTACQATITNEARGGYVIFNDTSTAGQANIVLRGRENSLVQFWDDSNAGAANIDIGLVTLMPVNQYNDAQFYGNSSAGNSTITVRGDGGRIHFFNNSTAGSATIVALGSTRPDYIGRVPGQVLFGSFSTAGNATITAEASTVAGAPGGLIQFHNGGHAGAATLIANGGATAVNGGRIFLASGAVGDSPRIVVNAGASADFSHSAFDGTVGSIEGAGRFSLGSSLLTVGNLNTSTTVGGNITDSGGFIDNPGGKLTKVGTGTLTLSGANSYTGLTTVDEGTLIVNGSIAGGAVVKEGGILKGTGSMGSVTVESGGLFTPGLSPGTITIGGLNLMSGSTLEYDLGAARDHIVVTNNGNVVLGGLLDLSILAGFDPGPGETFGLFEGAIGSITGVFSAVTAPIFNGHSLDLVYGFNQVTLQVIDAILPPGDYNKNGIVDAADYVVWRKTDGTQTGYNVWRAHFGQTAGNGAGANSSAAVPEPTTLFMCVAALIGCSIANARQSHKLMRR